MNSTLLHMILQHVQEKEWNRTDLAIQSGVHLSDISRILNQKQSLSMQNLDCITKGLGLPEGTFYPYYIEECFNESGYLDKRKSVQFLYKCGAEGNKKLLHSLLDSVMEERSKSIRNKNISVIFLAAEKLFKDGKEKEAMYLYEIVIENMPNHFAEEVAISYFRKFYIVRLTNEWHYSLGHVLEHIAYMPKEFQIQSYLWITATLYLKGEWKETLYYAQKLEKMTGEGEFFGRALLYQSLALRHLGGSLDAVLILIDRYAQINEYFADLSIGNRYAAYLEFGHLKYVDEYLQWLASRDDIFAGLPRVLEAYIRLNRLEDAERLLDRFQYIIKDISESNECDFKTQMYLRFHFAYSLYLFACKRYSEGLHEVLKVAFIAKKIGLNERFSQCLLLCWKYREYVTAEHEGKYMGLLQVDNMSLLP